jgi:hypothetical protein
MPLNSRPPPMISGKTKNPTPRAIRFGITTRFS